MSRLDNKYCNQSLVDILEKFGKHKKNPYENNESNLTG